MLVWVLVILATLHIGFFAGYFLREIRTKVKDLYSLIEKKKDKPEISTPKSNIIDPLDAEQEAKRTFNERMREINPDE